MDSGIVTVAPDDLVGVVTYWCHSDRSERPGRQLPIREDAKGIGRLRLLFTASSTGTMFAEMRPGEHAVMTIAPLDDQRI
jgi:hypothetical protein